MLRQTDIFFLVSFEIQEKRQFKVFWFCCDKNMMSRSNSQPFGPLKLRDVAL